MGNFNKAYTVVRKNEGDFANNPYDSGGMTWRGIARNMHPGWEGWKLIDKVFLEFGFKGIQTEAKAINSVLRSNTDLQTMVLKFYKTNFWDIIWLNKIDSDDVCTKIFDAAVNMGPEAAVEFLQSSLNACNQDYNYAVPKPLFEDLKVDGAIGNKTFSAYNQIKDKTLLMKVYQVYRGAYFLNITEHRPTQKVFIPSWFSRIF